MVEPGTNNLQDRLFVTGLCCAIRQSAQISIAMAFLQGLQRQTTAVGEKVVHFGQDSSKGQWNRITQENKRVSIEPASPGWMLFALACMQQRMYTLKRHIQKAPKHILWPPFPFMVFGWVQQLTKVLKCHSELQQCNSWLVFNSDSPGEKTELLFRVRAF